jgi:2-keto-4-pentenoate hydratase/2-oxohepta-3-ene-1,7-dioic acid hydratase in catechol pathway
MRWVTWISNGDIRSGLLDGEEIIDLGHRPVIDWLASGQTPELTQRARVPLGDVRLLAPVPRPGKILGIGLNYAAHAAESTSFAGLAGDTVQKWFNKQVTAANGPFDPVELPAVSRQLDYEAELVVVIGRTGRHVPAERALEIVAGVACGSDYSVRDWQKASATMIMGKGFDTHAPFGPAIVTLDELPALETLTIRGFVNGELRQEGVAGQMVHSIGQQIAHLTAAFTLEPGDVIFTGTPAGVGAGFEPPRYLCDGDRFRVEIDGVGAIENEIVTENLQTRIGD